MEFIGIQPGTFVMGSPDSEPERYTDEGPQHQVTLSKDFYMGKYEVTQAQWAAVMDFNPSHFVAPNHPVDGMSWSTAQDFIHKLNSAAGDSLYRLPTEAEWEYACRAGTTTPWSFGDDLNLLGDYAWYEENTRTNSDTGDQHRSSLVGQKRPNPWGLYDKHGNVSEWVQDRYGAYSQADQKDPKGPSKGTDRVIRGGEYTTISDSLTPEGVAE